MNRSSLAILFHFHSFQLIKRRFVFISELNEDCRNGPSKITTTIKLISSKEGVQPIEKSYSKQYQYLENFTASQNISWDEMIKRENGYVNDNSIRLEVEIDVEKPKGGAKSNKNTEAKFPQMECAACLEIIDSQVLSATPCGHLFCLECITKVVKDCGICPTCKTAVELDALHKLYLPV